jgi:hypothetical protein
MTTVTPDADTHPSVPPSNCDRVIESNRGLAQLWGGIDRILERNRDPAGLLIHGLGPIAAWRLWERGEAVPDALARQARNAAFVSMAAPSLLRTVREILDGPVILLKGAEVATYYPTPILRPYGDIDLLVPDLDDAEQRLRRAGFQAIGPEDHLIPGHHHDRPLRLPGTSLPIELHRDPGWLSWATPPSPSELFARAVPSRTDVDGILALPALDHLMLLASHSWRHGPFHTYLQLVDIAILASEVDAETALKTARSWGLEEVWCSTLAAIDVLIHGNQDFDRRIHRLWSRHLAALRERNLLEHYLSQWSRGIAAPTTRGKVSTMTADFRFAFGTRPWQTRQQKLRRIALALRRSRLPVRFHRNH